MTSVTDNLSAVRQRIIGAALAAGRAPEQITLIAVSKRHPISAISAAYAAGQRHFGENFVREGEHKIAELGHLDRLEWHFIGQIQRNKTRAIATAFDWVHTVDRELIAERLSAQRPAHARPLNVCLQVEVAARENRAGVDPAALPALASAVAQLPRLRLRGLMCLPPATEDMAQAQSWFACLRACLQSLNNQGFALDVLSAGMSNDVEAAIAEGATHVRVGTAVFGPRAQ